MQKKSTAADDDDDDPLSLSSFQFGFISGSPDSLQIGNGIVPSL